MDSKLGKNKELGLYIHIPFCHTKCTYCDFNTYSGLENLIDNFSDSIYKEINFWGITEFYIVDTIFIGGGTPSYIDTEIIKNIINKISDNFLLSKNPEITLEINPEDVTKTKALEWEKIGINRCSLGVQSLVNSELKILNRRHDSEKAMEAINILSKIFNNISVDLIYGLPLQTKDSYIETLKKIISQDINHISCYSLQVEKGTVLDQQVNTNKINVANDDLSAEMYKITQKILFENDFENYEISNWSKQNKLSQHNLKYWTMKPYIGIGPGSHSYIDNKRFSIIKSPKKYVDFFKKPLKNISSIREKILYLRENDFLDVYENQLRENEILEFLMLNLRLKDGININKFKKRFDLDFEDLYLNKLDYFIKENIIFKKEESYILSEKGKLFANEVANNFVK
ncbi:MAG: radical SAM family heme chaperone HemW [SAR202 cluster bacterium]|nr:MAG: radical SAM family heme chaperone HemW [SAR202 cluster bacterium]|tara:strand:- start:452 stop:1651 length:1200 start_codon:yes stop_codon:yes gene_type:complete